MTNYQTRVEDHHSEAKSLGYTVFGTFIQGSQNYDMAYDKSDVDTKCLVIPTFRDLCLTSKQTSFTHVRENNEHIDIKDFRMMFGNFLKQNVNMVEIMFSKMFVVSEEYAQHWDELCNMREDIVRYNELAGIRCCAGMAYEKRKALCHPYPSIKDKIDRYGYDPKQLHHIKRLEEFIKRFYMEKETFTESLIPTNKEFLMNLKTDAMPMQDAVIMADEAIENIDAMYSSFSKKKCSINEDIVLLLNNITVGIMETAYINRSFWYVP